MNMTGDRLSPSFICFSSNYRLKSFSISAVLKISPLKKSIYKVLVKELPSSKVSEIVTTEKYFMD